MTLRSLAATLLVCAAGAADAQTDSAPPLPPIPIGATVRMTAQGLIASRLEGQFRGATTTGIDLTVTKAGSMMHLPWSNASALQWRQGRDHWRGARDWGLTGLIFGALLYSSKYGDLNRSFPPNEARNDAIRFLGVFPAITATLGGAIGVHHWQPVPVPPAAGGTVTLDFQPTDDVRIESTLGTIEGRNAVASADSLRMTTAAGPFSLAWRNVGDLQVRGGKRRVRGAVIGAAIAFGIGVLGESVLEMSTAERLTSVAAGAYLGSRYLAPEGWISLPQPTR